MTTNKGFIKDQLGNILLPITRGELLLDSKGYIALNSEEFLAKDGHPGLLTAQEREMLVGTGNGQNLADIYTKLGHINSGLKVGQTTLNFYNEDGTSTPITFKGADNAPISITAISNKDTSQKITSYTVSLGLSTISVTKDSDTNRIKDITVDAYGRVTAITHGAITNDELPATIANKALSGCTTSDPTAANHIVSKSYVDDAVAGATSIATGALVFKGTIDKNSNLSQILQTSNLNGYYKVVTDPLTKEDVINITDAQDYNNTAREARLGDTLIVTEVAEVIKFVYIPSGNDDVVTSFTVKGKSATILDSKTGNIGLQFDSDALSVTQVSNSNIAKITLPKANASNNGYLSSTDWSTFNNYSSTLAVSYSPTITTSSAGYYEIGKLTIGGTPTTIYGQNNISTLSIDTTVTAPTLKFTETGKTDVKITFSGVEGVKTTKDGNTIKIAQNSTVKTGSSSYLEITDGTNGAKEFGVKIGTTTTNGLADTEFVIDAIESYTSSFEVINYSLKTANTGDPTDPYRYGNDKLKTAIAVDI